MNVADWSSSSPRFVLLRHEMPANHQVASHWDLMLEQPQGLYTLRLDSLPVTAHSAGIEPRASGEAKSGAWGQDEESIAMPATRLADHRQKYLEYAGPVSGDRGEVRAVARGVVDAQALGPATDDASQSAALGPQTSRTAVVDFEKGARIVLTTADGRIARLLLPPCSQHQDITLTIYYWSVA